MNNLVRAMNRDGKIVVSALHSQNILQKMEKIHKTSAVASAALGRTLTAAALIGSRLKEENHSVTLRIGGDGPLGALLAVSDGLGNVRGYVQNPVVELPLRADGKLDVGTAVGKSGILSLVRDNKKAEPYVGQTALVSGEIAQDITAYYAASEQTPCVCALGVLVNKDLSIATGGGFLLTLLPGATEEEIAAVESNLEKMKPVTELLQEGALPLDLIKACLQGFEVQVLEEREVDYRCYCSETRTRNMLLGLGENELKKMQEENELAKVECHFCNKCYKMEISHLLEHFKQPL